MFSEYFHKTFRTTYESGRGLLKRAAGNCNPFKLVTHPKNVARRTSGAKKIGASHTGPPRLDNTRHTSADIYIVFVEVRQASQVQTGLRSPYTLSMRAQAGQNLNSRVHDVGYAACVRV